MILHLCFCLFLIYCESRRYTGNVQGLAYRFHSALNPDAYPCNRELGPTGAGRYPRNIASQFPNNAVRCAGLSKNLFCSCDDRYMGRMVCYIHVRPDSDEERIVDRRLDIENPEGLPDRLRPFFTFFRPNLMFYKPILFEMADCYPEVVAEIYVRKDLPFPQLMRSESSPPKVHYPYRTISLKQCTNGDGEAINHRVCPITLQPFEVHSLVHVLKSDAKKVEERKSVICISDEGLRSLALSTRDHSFLDPLKRKPGYLTIRGDYNIYIVTYGADQPCFSEAPANEPGTSQFHSQAGPPAMSPFQNNPSSPSTDSEISGMLPPTNPPSSSIDSELSGTFSNREYDTNSNFKIVISINVLILFTFFISLFTFHWCMYTRSFSNDLYTEFISAPDI